MSKLESTATPKNVDTSRIYNSKMIPHREAIDS